MASISTAELRILITAQDSASKQLAGIVGGFGSLASQMTTVGAAMSRSITLPLAAAAGGMLKEAADLEQGLDIFVNQTRKAGDDFLDNMKGFGEGAKRMAEARRIAIELGADATLPKTSATDAMNTMVELSKAGLSVDQTFKAVHGTLLLAAAAQVEGSKAADLQSSALKAFALDGSKADDVANMIVRTMEISRAKFSDIALAITNGAGAFATMGKELPEFLVMTSTLVDLGISGGRAATSLRRAISAITAPTAKASAEMEKYGISLYDAQGKAKSFPDFLDNLQDGLKGLSDQQTFAAIKTIFGQEGFKSIAPLLMGMKHGSEAVRELSAAFDNSEISEEEYLAALEKLGPAGVKLTDQLRNQIKDLEGNKDAAKLAAEAINKGFKGALDNVISSLQTAGAVLGAPFLQRLSNLTRGFAEVTVSTMKWLDANPRILEMAATFGAVVASVGPLLFIMGKLLTLAGALLTPFGLLTVGLAALAAAWSVDFGGIQHITDNVLSRIHNGLDQTGKDWSTWAAESGDAGATVGKSLSGLSGLVLAFQFAMQQNWPAAQKAWDTALEDFGSAGQHAQATMGNFVSDVITKVGDLAGVDVRGVTGWMDKLGALVGLDTTNAVDGLGKLAMIGKQLADLSLGGVADTLARLFGLTFSPDLDGVDRFVSAIKQLADLSLGGVADLIAKLTGIKFPTDMSGLDKLKDLADVSWTNLTDMFAKLGEVSFKKDLASDVDNLAGALSNLKTIMDTLSGDSGNTGKFLTQGPLAIIFGVDFDFATRLKVLSTIGTVLSGVAEQATGAAARIVLAFSAIGKSLQAMWEIGADPQNGKQLTDRLQEIQDEWKQASDAIASEQAASRERTAQALKEADEQIRGTNKAAPIAPIEVPVTLDTSTLEPDGEEIVLIWTDVVSKVQESVDAGMGGVAEEINMATLPIPEAIQANLEPIVPIVNAIGTDLNQALIEQLDQIPENFNTAASTLVSSIDAAQAPAQSAAKDLGSNIVDTISAAMSVVTPTAFADELPAQIEQAAPEVEAAGTTVGEAGVTGVASGAEGIDAAVAPIPVAIQAAFDEAVAAIDTSGAAITASTTTTFTQVVSIVTEQMAASTAAVTAGGAEQQAAIETANAAILASETTTWAAIVAQVTTSTAQATAAVVAGGAAMTAAIEAAGTAMVAAMTAAGSAMVASMASSMAQVVSVATSGAAAAVAAVNAQVGAAGAAGAAVGGAMVSGMEGAILAGAGRVASAAAALVSAGLSAARAAADAHSPSKATYQVGQDLVDGLVNALNDNKNAAAGAFREMVDSFIVQLQDVIKAEEGINQAEESLANNRDRAGRAELARHAEIQGVLLDELRIKEQLANINLQALPQTQALARAERDLARMESDISSIRSGSLADQQKSLGFKIQDNALAQKENQLQMMLLDAQNRAPIDKKTGRKKDTQEIADIKAAIDQINNQSRALDLQTKSIDLQNEARALSRQGEVLNAKASIEAQKLALRASEDQKFTLSQQAEQLAALSGAWSAHEAVVKGVQQNQIDDAQRAINAMKDQAAITPEVFQAGIKLLTDMRDAGVLSQQEFEKFRNVLQGMQKDTANLGTNVPAIAATGDAAAIAGQKFDDAGVKIDVAGSKVADFGASGAKAGAIIGTAGEKGMEEFVAAAGNAATAATIQIVNSLNAQQGAVYNAAYSLGTAVGQGLTNGIIDSGNIAINAAIEVANQVIMAMRIAFDARSPSRQSYFIGQDVMDGLINGLNNPTVADTIKHRIQQYIDTASQYRSLIPEAIDNEMKIISTRIAQAKALLGILDLEFRMKDAQRRVEDAKRGGIDDQIKLINLDRARETIHMQELQLAESLTAQRNNVANIERQIARTEKGSLDDRLRGLALEQAQNILSRERIGIERRLTQIQAAGIQTQIDAFNQQGLQVMDPTDPQQQEVNALHNRLAAIDDQNSLLQDESDILRLNGQISSYNLKVQLEGYQDSVDLLEDQQALLEQSSSELQRQSDLITVANNLRSFDAQVEAAILGEQHLAQQRVIDDLDRQYEALNRQKQVYDAILRAVDYLHDLLIDEGVIADPFAASARLAGTSAAKSSAASSKSAQAKKDAEDTVALVGNAEAALAKLGPVVTGITAAGVAGAAAVSTAANATTAAAGRMLVTIGNINTSTFRVSVDDTTIREATGTAEELQASVSQVSGQTYMISVDGTPITATDTQAIALQNSLQGVTQPIDLVINGQAVTLSASQVVTLQQQMSYLNTVRPTLSVEDQAIQDANFGIVTMGNNLNLLDDVPIVPSIVPVIDAAPLFTFVDTTTNTVIPAPVETVVDDTEVQDVVQFAAETHELTLDDILDRKDTDDAVAFAKQVHPLTIDDILNRQDTDTAVTFAAQTHPLNVDDIVTRDELDQAIDDSNEKYKMDITTTVQDQALKKTIDEINKGYTLKVNIKTSGSIGGSKGGNSGLGKASGGPVDPQRLYTVGEAGRELFVPWTHGFILPNDLTERILNAKDARRMMSNYSPVSGAVGAVVPTGGQVNNQKTVNNNFQLNYTAMGQSKTGYSDVDQVMRDMVAVLSMGG